MCNYCDEDGVNPNCRECDGWGHPRHDDSREYAAQWGQDGSTDSFGNTIGEEPVAPIAVAFQEDDHCDVCELIGGYCGQCGGAHWRNGGTHGH